jgi:lipopolysaccharide transport system permease protein
LNPHAQPSISPRGLAKSIWSHRALIASLTRREISGRYKGSYFGILWSLLTPLLMLTVFTFVFGEIFQARWGNGQMTGRLDFAVALFTGLLIYNFFSECLSKAPLIILTNPNYVKKVIFPIEILPIVTVAAALFHLAIASLVLLVLVFFSGWSLNIGVLYTPLILLPFLLFVLGVTWFTAALGVYLRDVSQIIAPALTAMLFLSPVFYPLSSVPDHMEWLFLINPVTFVIEQVRAVMLHHLAPSALGLALYGGVGLITAWLGAVFFQKTRRGFSDVL